MGNLKNKKNKNSSNKRLIGNALVHRRYDKTNKSKELILDDNTNNVLPSNETGNFIDSQPSTSTRCSYIHSSPMVNLLENDNSMTGISYLSPIKNVLCDEKDNNNYDIDFSENSYEKNKSSQSHTLINNIESHKLAVDTETEDLYNINETHSQISGNRIVDIAYVFNQIQNNIHDGGFGCNFMNMEFLYEIRLGFYSEYWFNCKMCNIKQKIQSVKNSPTTDWSINKSVVNSTIAIGIGYTQINEFCAGIEIPSMSAKSYIFIENILQIEIKNSAWVEMKKAGEEEKKIALELGNVDTDGVPLITVVADGQWSKRSYKTKYDAFSGVASIIGYQTKKMLFVGIRNRYCVICERAINKNTKAPDHVCFLNWKQGATSIEADAIAEGFKNSVEMHGLKFSKLIGDGDSSVTKRLHEILPYGQALRVEKIECRNHLLRNYSQKMMALTKRTEFPIEIRKKISNNIIRLRTDITCAIKFRKAEDRPLHEKISGLRFDIVNAPNHRIFDDHKNCSPYFCDKKSSIQPANNFTIKDREISREIETVVSRLSKNAKSLLLDVDNNSCEQFNSVINKFLGGKRINFTQKSSYSTRVYAAVISFNSSQYLRTVKKNITQISPGVIGKKFLKRVLEKRYKCQKRRKVLSNKKPNLKPKRLNFSKKADENYGNADKLDILRDINCSEFENEMNQFVKKLGEVDRYKIERETRDQACNDIWKRERLCRLTASNFGRICKMRANTSCKSTIYSILYSSFTSKSIQYGKDMEGVAKIKFEEMYAGIQIKPSGLFIDEEFAFLAASPDGIIDEKTLVEIKAPYSAKNSQSAIEAVESGKLPYCKIENGQLKLNHNHNYFYQVQGQLHISKRDICYFIIYSPQWISVEKIKYENDFWITRMVDKLKSFYLDCLLPEIIDPAYKYRLMVSDIRESKKVEALKNQKKS